MQLSLGLPCPREESTLPVLKRVLDGIRRARSTQNSGTPRIRMPITVTVLRQIRTEINRSPEAEPDRLAFWAIATVAFFGFFRLGELLVGTEAEYTAASHLSWGDVAVGYNSAPSLVKIHLRKSKCDQFGAGADILLGRTGCDLCPVAAIRAYISQRGRSPGHFFLDGEGKTITKPWFITQLRGYLKSAGLPSDQFAGPQPQQRRSAWKTQSSRLWADGTAQPFFGTSIRHMTGWLHSLYH